MDIRGRAGCSQGSSAAAVPAWILRRVSDEIRAEIERLIAVYERYMDRVTEILRSAKLPDPTAMPSNVILTALLLKILRLADSMRGMVSTGHARDAYPLLRTMEQAFVNLKFICLQPDKEAASVAYFNHGEEVRRRMKRHLVRAEVAGETFPRWTPEAWAEFDAQVKANTERIAESMRERNITPMKRFRIGVDGHRITKLREDTWTGMTDEEMFALIGEKDAYRFYALFSNDIHVNVGGLGSLLEEVNRGAANVNDDEGVVIAFGEAGRILHKSFLVYDKCFGTDLAERVMAVWQDFEREFAAHSKLQRARA
jgi:hypothetical protein